MAVTEALMSLFLKELISVDRVVGVAKGLWPESDATPSDQEEALLAWVDSAAQALKKEIVKELEVNSFEYLIFFFFFFFSIFSQVLIF